MRQRLQNFINFRCKSDRLSRVWVLLLMAMILSMGAYSQSTANYTFSTSSTGSLVDMSSGTTDLLATGTYRDDVASSVFNIGFNAVFMGGVYSQFSVNSNGQMRLGSTVIGGGSQSPAVGVPLIAPITGDNAVRATGKVHYKVTGSAPNRSLVVEWVDLRIPFGSSVETGTYCNLQAILYESSGVIEYIYGRMYNMSTSTVTRGIYFSTGTTAGQIGQILTINTTPAYNSNSTSVTTTTFALSADMTNLNSTSNGARTVFTFTPPATAPTAPSSLTFTNVGMGGMKLNWTDNSSDEATFVIMNSTDNITFSTVATVAVNSTSYYALGLSSGTTYYWKVYAANEGKVSSSLDGTQATGSSPSLSGTKTIGGTLPDYATLTEAVNDLTAQGLAGARRLLSSSTSTRARAASRRNADSRRWIAPRER